jgi:hypothetical protein
MTLFGEPLATFVPGLAIIAALGAMGWLIHLRRQASPQGRRVRARGWTFNDDQDIEGPLAGVPGARFQTRCAQGRAWAEVRGQPERSYSSEDNDGPSFWEFRVMVPGGVSAAPAAHLRWPTPSDRAAWLTLLSGEFGSLEDRQMHLHVSEAGFRLQVDGAPCPKNTDALVQLAERCLLRLTGRG